MSFARPRLIPGLLALLTATCHQAILTAPPGAVMTLFANPGFIPAHGGVAVISALVYEKTGTPAADGTVIQFFTNLGRIDEQGKTNDGVARVNLIADSRSGKATVTALSGSVSATAEVAIGSSLPERVIVVAYPTHLVEQRASLITANVFDSIGNPVANVPIIFNVAATDTSTILTETMDSQGSPTFTDNNGQAQDVMRTRYDRASPAKTVKVTATTANGKTGEVTITIN